MTSQVWKTEALPSTGMDNGGLQLKQQSNKYRSYHSENTRYK